MHSPDRHFRQGGHTVGSRPDQRQNTSDRLSQRRNGVRNGAVVDDGSDDRLSKRTDGFSRCSDVRRNPRCRIAD